MRIHSLVIWRSGGGTRNLDNSEELAKPHMVYRKCFLRSRSKPVGMAVGICKEVRNFILSNKFVEFVQPRLGKRPLLSSKCLED